MFKFLKEISTELIRSPKKYLSVLGALLICIGIAATPMTCSSGPYYLSYMQIKANLTAARYANGTYTSHFVLIFNALTTISLGLLKNNYNISLKRTHFLGFMFFA